MILLAKLLLFNHFLDQLIALIVKLEEDHKSSLYSRNVWNDFMIESIKI